MEKKNKENEKGEKGNVGEEGKRGQMFPEKYDHRTIEPKWPRKTHTSSRGLRPRSRGASLRGKENYNHRLIEPKWEKRWEKSGIYKAVDFAKKPKKYLLFEFPYPSGDRLHVGHGRSYTALDAVARKYRMSGFNVMLPMGWDAFGLPAENYAIKNKVNPNVVVKENIAHAKAQAKRWGLSIDWDREIDTTDPKYYRWTQWIFVQLFKKGLAYRSEVAVNWCPFCKTNLANEEVLSDGTHERCGNKTQRRMQKQWLLKITKYADRLIDDLKEVDYLPRIAQQQINWIGRSEGTQIEFKVQSSKFKVNEKVTVFTTRPDTLYGATFMVISPEHELVAKILEGKIGEIRGIREIGEYVEKAKRKTEIERVEETKDKTGVFSGLFAINPITKKEIPIWISDFVLSSYGTGAIMAVPAHDERDFAFAKKFGLPIVPVIIPRDQKEKKDEMWDFEKEAYTKVGEGITINSPEWNGLIPSEAIKKAISWLEEKGIGKKETSYHLRDWVFSRQHYWGEPIPMIFCEHCSQKIKSEIRNPKSEITAAGGIPPIGGTNSNFKFQISNSDMAGWWPVPEEQLPVELPYLEQYEPSGTGESPLSKVTDWVNTKCPHCGGPAKRETDTMPNWAGSNWYYVAYLFGDKLQNQESRINPFDKLRIDAEQSRSIKNQSEQGNIFLENKELLKYWLPVDLYNGGMEHTTLHLLYSRFIYKFLYDIGVVPTKEPYIRRRSHGMVLGPDGQKMSKSRGNVINPDEIIEAFGADTFRLYESFMGPFDQMIAWNQESLEGCCRFLKRVWNLVDGWEEKDDKGNPTSSGSAGLRGARKGELGEMGEKGLERKLNQTIKKVGEDIDNMKFNTAIAAMMELLNEMGERGNPISPSLTRLPTTLKLRGTSRGARKGEVGKEELEKFLLILAPFAPHITEQLWEKLGKKFSIHQQQWPQYNPDLLEEETVIIAVQVNGKLRGTIEVQSAKCKVQSEVEKIAKKDEKVKKYLAGPSFAESDSASHYAKATRDKSRGKREIKKTIFIPGKLINFVI